MRLSSDIKMMIEDDARKLAQAFCAGTILAGGNSLTMIFDEGSLHSLAADITRYQLKGGNLSLVLPYLSSMKWLTLTEACIYSRKSRNTVLKLIEEAKIYGTKAEGGDYVVERESIDAYYNKKREDLKEKLRELKERWVS